MLEPIELTLALLPAVIAFVEIYKRSPLALLARRILKKTAKSISVLGAQQISDHWKEKAFQAYGLSIMKDTLLIGLWLAILAIVFAGIFQITGMLWDQGHSSIVELARTETIIFATVIATLYILGKRAAHRG